MSLLFLSLLRESVRIFLFFSLRIRTSRLSLNERKRHSLIKINFHYSFFFLINRRLKEKRKENYFKRMRFLIKKKEETLSMALSFLFVGAITSLLFLKKESYYRSRLSSPHFPSFSFRLANSADLEKKKKM